MRLPSPVSSRAVATVMARTRDPAAPSTSSSTTFSVAQPLDRLPPARPSALPPRVGDGAPGGPRRPPARSQLEPSRGEDTLAALESVAAETRALSQTINVNKSSVLSTPARGRLATSTGSSTQRKHEMRSEFYAAGVKLWLSVRPSPCLRARNDESYPKPWTFTPSPF